MNKEDIKIIKIGNSYYKLEPTDSDSMNHEYEMSKIDVIEAINLKIKNIESIIDKLANDIEKINDCVADIKSTLYKGDGFGVIE